ncbi:MAG: cyclase family protein [Planctomycetota bacterium]|nr:cyclase family protein [Planctomycetota bacterium]MDA1114644.1 cyclase family protein [Planctomycetota bacterium]
MILDISPVISPRLGVWPGDTGFLRNVCMDTNLGDNITLSAITTTLHLGAHVDAPNHYRAGAKAMHERELERYYGPCQVMAVDLPRGERIRPQHLSARLEAPRLLFHTGSFPDPDQWNADFNSLSAELIGYLFDAGVRLVGIDTPSVDLQDDKVLESHQAIADRDMAILEGIVLEKVDPGLYTLCAFPLALEGADASPVRAVLIRD